MSKRFLLARRIAKLRGKIHELKQQEKRLLAELKKTDVQNPKRNRRPTLEDYFNAPAIEPSRDPWFGDIVWD